MNLFYRDHWKAAGIRPERINSLDDFRERIPSVEKQDFSDDQLAVPGFMDNWPLSDGVRRTIPLDGAVSIQELSPTVAFLLSDEAGSITGQNIMIDGGVNRGP